MSERDYPTDEELKRIEEWPVDDPLGWFAFIKLCWWMPDWGWSEEETPEGRRYRISTGGWSGNESIIGAMQATKDPAFPPYSKLFGLYRRTWYSSRRGGHYEFKVSL